MEYVKTINGKAVKDEEAREEIEKLKPHYYEEGEEIYSGQDLLGNQRLGYVYAVDREGDTYAELQIKYYGKKHFKVGDIICISSDMTPCVVSFVNFVDDIDYISIEEKPTDLPIETGEDVYIGPIAVTEIYGVPVKDKVAREKIAKHEEKLAEVSKFKWHRHIVMLPYITGEYENGEFKFLCFLSEDGTPATTVRELRKYFQDRFPSFTSSVKTPRLCIAPEILNDGEENPQQVQYVYIDNTKIEIGAVVYEDGFVKFVMDATLDTPLTDEVTEL